MKKRRSRSQTSLHHLSPPSPESPCVRLALPAYPTRTREGERGEEAPLTVVLTIVVIVKACTYHSPPDSLPSEALDFSVTQFRLSPNREFSI